MFTDGTKVQQILYNLLSNAIKFAEQGEVRVMARPVSAPLEAGAPAGAPAVESPLPAAGAPEPAAPRPVTHVAFAVSDTGPGIPRDEHLRIFERFTQLDSGPTKRYRGTGLGLSIVKELTGLLGGTVTVDSEVGRGATFTVALPVDSGAAEARQAETVAAAAAQSTPRTAQGGKV
jgi:signal transduction histidine kinase